MLEGMHHRRSRRLILFKHARYIWCSVGLASGKSLGSPHEVARNANDRCVRSLFAIKAPNQETSNRSNPPGPNDPKHFPKMVAQCIYHDILMSLPLLILMGSHSICIIAQSKVAHNMSQESSNGGGTTSQPTHMPPTNLAG